MNRVFLLLLGVLVWTPFQLSGAASVENEKIRLHILTWSEYLDEELVTAFEKHHGVKIQFTYFETDEHRDMILTQQGVDGFDLAIVDSSQASQYQKLGWLSELNTSQLSQHRQFDPFCYEGQKNLVSVTAPYFWGTLGIVYRSDLIDQPITHWKHLFAPPEELRGRILMIDDSMELLGMAAVSQGKSMSTEKVSDWEAAGQLAFRQKPYVKRYGYSTLNENSSLLNGEIWVAQMYNGDALALQEFNEDLVYVHPREGSSFWVDYWVIFRSSQKKQLAHAFLDFINEPVNAAANAESIYFAPCNLGASNHLSSDFMSDPNIFPPAEVMKNLQPYTEISPRTWARVNTLFSQIVDSD